MRVIVVVLLALCFVATAAGHDKVDRMSYAQLAKEGRKAVRNGGTYSVRHGHCSRYLKRISHELVERAFSRFGTQSWAQSIVARESGHCPGAVNTTYSSWEEQAQGLAQLIPKYHTWVNYKRMKSDPAYAVAVFVRLSKGGRNVQPWCLC